MVKGGTLCFWGHWFGKPYDNLHRIVSVDMNVPSSVLTLRFDQNETLIITNPVEIEEFPNRILINKADKVYWQWYYYGKAQEIENIFHHEYVREGNILSGKTNINWRNEDFSDLSISKPAVVLT